MRFAVSVAPRRSLLLPGSLLVAAVCAAAPAHAGTIDWGACPEPGVPGDDIGTDRYVVVASSSDDSASGAAACTLRDAINTVELGEAQFGCVVDGAGEPTPGAPWAIVLPTYTYTLDGSELVWSLNSGPDSYALCGQGVGDTVIRAAASPGTATNRVLRLIGPAYLRTWGVSIENGRSVAPPTLLGDTPLDGGGVLVENGFFDLRDSRIAFNSTDLTGGGLACGGLNDPCFALTNSIVDHNFAGLVGGGISGRGHITSSVIAFNEAGVDGGGLFTQVPIPFLTGASAGAASPASMRNTQIANNSAGRWGGGWYDLDYGWAESVTIAYNSAREGGGLVVHSQGNFKEYFNNLTVSNNRAEPQLSTFASDLLGFDYQAAGVWARSTALADFFSATIVDNENLPPVFVTGGGGGPFAAGLVIESGGTVGYRQSIIARNEDGGVIRDCDLAGTALTYGYNRGGATCLLDGVGDLPANLGSIAPLGINGGSTASAREPADRTLPTGTFLPTHAILAESDPVDAGPEPCSGFTPESTALSTDARGFLRVDGDGNGSVVCDIGAFEYGAEKVIWIDGFEVEFVSPCNWSVVNDPVLCVL